MGPRVSVLRADAGRPVGLDVTTLHLGVLDLSYASEHGTTIGDVAGYLENKYHVMENFAEAHDTAIADALANSVARYIENVMMGAPTDLNPSSDEAFEVGLIAPGLSQSPFMGATSAIRHEFDQFITREEMDGLVKGVPTLAAVKGKSKRFKSGRGPRRPSFVDSGLYLGSFVAWIDE